MSFIASVPQINIIYDVDTTNSRIIMSYSHDSRENLRISASSQITGDKLPTNLQVLQVLFFNIRSTNFSLEDSCRLLTKEIKIFWSKANIPTQEDHKCIQKIENMHKKYRDMQKNLGKYFNEEKEQKFSKRLNEIFDISHGSFRDSMTAKERYELFALSLDKISNRKTNSGTNKRTLINGEKNIQLKLITNIPSRNIDNVNHVKRPNEVEIMVTLA